MVGGTVWELKWYGPVRGRLSPGAGFEIKGLMPFPVCSLGFMLIVEGVSSLLPVSVTTPACGYAVPTTYGL